MIDLYFGFIGTIATVQAVVMFHEWINHKRDSNAWLGWIAYAIMCWGLAFGELVMK